MTILNQLNEIIFQISGISSDGSRSTKRIVSTFDSLEIMNNPDNFGFRSIFSVNDIDDERLEIIGEEPPAIERRSQL